jgi:hypothetical protein
MSLGSFLREISLIRSSTFGRNREHTSHATVRVRIEELGRVSAGVPSATNLGCFRLVVIRRRA